MITEVNNIKRFFEALGITANFQQLPDNWSYRLHKMTVTSEKTLERCENLVSYYFERAQVDATDSFIVRLSEFNPEGHGRTGICKKCGCSDDLGSDETGCIDDAGNGCYLVKDDLCSACADPADVDLHRNEISEFHREYELKCAKKVLGKIYLADCSHQYATKNKLEEAISTFFTGISRMVVQESRLEEFMFNIQRSIVALNCNYPQCKPFKVEFEKWQDFNNKCTDYVLRWNNFEGYNGHEICAFKLLASADQEVATS